MPRAVLFGLEGVLVDRVGARAAAIRSVLEEEGVSIAPGELEAAPPSPPYERWLTALLAGRGRPADAALGARLMARASAVYRAALRDSGPRWMPGGIELARRVAGHGLPAALVAEADRDEVERALEHGRLTASFQVVVTAADLAEPAERLSGYELALSRLNSQPPLPERLFHPHEVAAVAGTGAGLAAASAAGLVTVRVGTPAAGEPRADFHAASPADIDPEWLLSG